MSKFEELLVGIINNLSDFEIIQNQNWYRIPTDKAERLIKNRWPQCGLHSIIQIRLKIFHK